ncbi:sensor histidine kinase [Micromonospora sp. NBC_01813]|uniref:sensor histidine kinase n=1 Tax=Micromonospora sp. NBC_01813 TaxID=2975988 RepID=UPI002DDC74AF|nr:sensor histidine kinase [Micromonospora sp. NBC_01813]WSA10997.1 sensor histidine kinase [Micromonospora sp. NBC_01813]
MSRSDPRPWSGLVGVLTCLAVGAPVLVLGGGASPAFLVPVWLWWTCFAGFVGALVVCTLLVDRVRDIGTLLVFAAQVGLAVAVVLMAPAFGWTQILLVFGAAVSTYLNRWPVTVAVVALNTAVAAVAAYLNSGAVTQALLNALLYALLQAGVVLSVQTYLRELATRRKLAEAHTELRAATVLLAQATRSDERLRIARELHDLIGHQLTVLTLELEVAAHQSAPPAAEHVTRARQVARDLLADVRGTVGELRRHSPDLREALQRIVAELPEPAVHLRVADGIAVDEERVTALVRCVQEVVTNTIRHAGAANLWIEISDDEGTIRLSAWDDGRGTGGEVRPGNGLCGIRERVEALGGRVSLDGGRGFRVRAEVPAA